MKILHRYILKQLCMNLLIVLSGLTVLFLVFDFMDRIDNIVSAGATFALTFEYFILKIPLTVNLMIPVSMLVATLFTFGMLSRHSEVIAMRSAGLSIWWLARPCILLAIVMSLISILLGETLVPLCTRRVREVYNLDIQQKDKRGTYSQNDFWWRNGENFYSLSSFDSRSNTILGFAALKFRPDFTISRRTEAETARFVEPGLGWTLYQGSEYFVAPDQNVSVVPFRSIALPMPQQPRDFYDVRAESDTMSYAQLRSFINDQRANGIKVEEYFAELYQKLAFPFVTAVITLVVIPFALRSTRNSSLAPSFSVALIVGFSYYIVHSFSIALGRAQIYPPLLSAWLANIIFAFIGLVLLAGAEAPQ